MRSSARSQLDPALHDAYFGIGLYHYYADVAPAAARMLRWLLLLPGGDRAEGCRRCCGRASGGQLLRSEADYQLHLIYLWYEKQPLAGARAAERHSRERHPRNPHFPQPSPKSKTATLLDHAASLRTWQALLDRRAQRSRRPCGDDRGARANSARRSQLVSRSASTRPRCHTCGGDRRAAAAPVGAVALAHLQLGYVSIGCGRRDEAIAAYRAALAANPRGDPLKIDVARARRTSRTDALSVTRNAIARATSC